jgi:hypothetical protein
MERIVELQQGMISRRRIIVGTDVPDVGGAASIVDAVFQISSANVRRSRQQPSITTLKP